MIKHKLLILMLMVWFVPGCSISVPSVTGKLASNISSAILNQNDPETVREGAPAYLILIDGLIEEKPNSVSLLLKGTRLYDAYATAFVEDELRAQRFTDKAWGYSKRALCVEYSDHCLAYQQPFNDYAGFLTSLKRSDVPVLFAFASSWAGWIQTHNDDWNARADIPKVEISMQRVVELDETYRQGEPYLYLGVLSIILPPALGGKPEQSLAYFERAIELSDGRNLMFKVLFAERYARMLFDRELHDRLLNEVLAADPVEEGMTLMNTIAQERARKLLESGDEYF